MLPDQAVPDPGTGQRPDPQASRQRRADSDTSGVPRPDRLPGETAVPEAPTVVAPTMVADDGVPGPPRGGRGPGPWLIAALAGVLVLGLAAGLAAALRAGDSGSASSGPVPGATPSGVITTPLPTLTTAGAAVTGTGLATATPTSAGKVPAGRVVVPPRAVSATRTVLVSRPWGSGPADFGQEPGHQAASIGPSAVLVRADGSMLLLDTVNSRVLSFTATGQPAGTDSVPVVEGRPVDELVLAPDTGRIYAISTLAGQAYLLGPGEHRWVDFHSALSDAVVGSRMYYDQASHRVYRMVGSGSEPVLTGDAVAGKRMVNGLVTRLGLLDARVSTQGDPVITLRRQGGTLAATLPMHATATDLLWLPSDDGVLWFRVAVVASAPDTYRSLIVRYDPARGSAVSFPISVHPYGDTIDPLAASGRRVVAIDGDNTGGQLVAYDLVD